MSEPVVRLSQFTTLVDGLDHPEGVAWGADGNWYAGGEAGQVYRIATDGTFAQVASTGGFVLGLALDANHNIFACDLFKNKVFKVSPAGRGQRLFRGQYEPQVCCAELSRLHRKRRSIRV